VLDEGSFQVLRLCGFAIFGSDVRIFFSAK
jgi:hypothetical protein